MAKTLEEIAKQLKKMKFKSALVGGVDKKDVWKKIERLNDDYMQYIEQQRIGYEAVLAEKDRMIAGGITVNAAQILPGHGAMPPMDPGMMGGMPPYGDPSSAPIGAPSPQGEGINRYGNGTPSSQGEGMYGGAAMLPPMLDENGNPLPMPPMDQNMMPAAQQPSPWGEGAPTGADEGSYAGLPPMPPAMMGLPLVLDENGNPIPMPPMDPAMMMPQMQQPSPWGEGAPTGADEGPYAGLPPMDPAMMSMPPMPMAPGADYAPPAGGFEPDWGSPASAQNAVRPLQGELGPQGPEGVYPPPADLAYAHPVDMHPHGDPAMAQFADPSSTASGPPSPQGEGLNGGLQDLPLEGKVAAQPTDEVFYPTPPAMMGVPPMTPPGPQMPPFNPGPVPGGMPVSPEGVG